MGNHTCANQIWTISQQTDSSVVPIHWTACISVCFHLTCNLCSFGCLKLKEKQEEEVSSKMNMFTTAMLSACFLVLCCAHSSAGQEIQVAFSSNYWYPQAFFLLMPFKLRAVSEWGFVLLSQGDISEWNNVWFGEGTVIFKEKVSMTTRSSLDNFNFTFQHSTQRTYSLCFASDIWMAFYTHFAFGEKWCKPKSQLGNMFQEKP